MWSGSALNGGQSMFSRRYGLTARSIIAVELVDAAGEFRRVTDTDDDELIWALRGGGGLFGVVTAIEVALYPGQALFGGSLAFPAQTAVDVIGAATELARDVPELGLDLGMARFPDIPLVPPPLRGQTVATVALVHVGDEATGRAYADRLISVAEPIADTLTAFTIGSLAAVAAEPTDPMPSADFGGSIDTLDAAFAREFVDVFLAAADLGLMRCSVRTLGGAIAEELGAEFSAVGAVQAGGFLNSGVVLFDPTLDPGAGAAAAARPRRTPPRRPHRADVPRRRVDPRRRLSCRRRRAARRRQAPRRSRWRHPQQPTTRARRGASRRWSRRLAHPGGPELRGALTTIAPRSCHTRSAGSVIAEPEDRPWGSRAPDREGIPMSDQKPTVVLVHGAFAESAS